MEQDIITVEVPKSKSIANRLQIINALQGELMNFENSQCDDVELMRKALSQESETINIGHCGTAMRFLTAYFAQKVGCKVILDGSERMRQRPIETLVNKLRELGADIEYLGIYGCPPLQITGRILRGGEISFNNEVSSQYISALMMIAPYLSSPLVIKLPEIIGSRPYINLTAQLMCESGAYIVNDQRFIIIDNTPYQIVKKDVEGDWSAASYWYALCALTRRNVEIRNLDLPSVQGDSKIVRIFKDLGVETLQTGFCLKLIPSERKESISTNLSDTPDIAQTLIVTCCLLGVPFAFSGLASLQYKECDRLWATQRELAKLGYDLAIGTDWAIWTDRLIKPTSCNIATYDDHRMAMAFSLVATRQDVNIQKKSVVSKSFPTFWENFEKFGLRVGHNE